MATSANPEGSPPSNPEKIWCGDNRDRTGNLRRARAALSQLSYIPTRTIPTKSWSLAVNLKEKPNR